MRSIIEIKLINQALEHIDQNVDLVFFDIDNPLLAAADRANVVSWAEGFERYIRTQYAQRHNLSLLQQDVLVAQYITEYVNTMQTQLVEQHAIDIIKTLQQRNTHIIALTARPHGTATVSSQQLAHCGISLSDHVLNPKTFHIPTLKYPITFQDGIISCGNTPKGQAAVHLFNMTNIKPKSVVLIDDTAPYLEEMAQTLTQAGIGFKGLRYSYLDEAVRQFIFSLEHLPPHLR